MDLIFNFISKNRFNSVNVFSLSIRVTPKCRLSGDQFTYVFSYHCNRIQERMIQMDHTLTEIIFLLDRSGSMAGLEEDTIGGFNAFIDKQKKLPGITKLTTVLFDHKYELLWDGIDATEAILTEKIG